jgi:4-carboxymuconolactone decarboxylase
MKAKGIHIQSYNHPFKGDALMSDEQYEKGKEIAGKLLGKTAAVGREELSKISPMHGRAIYEYCFGTVWAQPLLPLKTKELILIAICASQGEYEGVKRQVRGGLNLGATEDEIIEAITTCGPYIGYPRTNGSLRAAKSVFDQWDEMEEWKSV